MRSFTTPPVPDVLRRLFQAAEDTDAPLQAELARRTERIARVQKGDYRDIYHRMRANYLSISPALGALLYILARARRAKFVVEFGLSFGISTIHLASALRDNGGGRLITTELEPEKAARARENLAAAGLADLVEIRVGDALETLKDKLESGIDFVLLDGAKPLYLPILQLLEPRLSPGALIATDDTDRTAAYVEYVRNPKNGYVSAALPFDDGSELSLRLR